MVDDTKVPTAATYLYSLPWSLLTQYVQTLLVVLIWWGKLFSFRQEGISLSFKFSYSALSCTYLLILNYVLTKKIESFKLSKTPLSVNGCEQLRNLFYKETFCVQIFYSF